MECVEEAPSGQEEGNKCKSNCAVELNERTELLIKLYISFNDLRTSSPGLNSG